MAERNKFMGVNFIRFYTEFPDEASCYDYLSSIKCEKGYTCKKCGHINYCKRRNPYSRRCIRCKYDESPTSGTMLDKCKFSIHLTFKLSTKKKGVSTLELSHEFDLRQKTCWDFKRKIQQAMRSSMLHPLTGTVHVDGFEEGHVGRSSASKKRLVVVALEVLPEKGGVGRAYAQVISNALGEGFKPFFNDHISPEVYVVTDEWKGYLPLKRDYPNLEQLPSNKGSNFPELHIHIMNLQGWLRGIHHHCSKEHLQGYFE